MSQTTATTMAFKFWLTFDSYGRTRVTKSSPALKSNERTMFMTVTLPKSMFTLPELRGSITIKDDGREPFLIDIEAASNALKAAIGVDIDLHVFKGDAPAEAKEPTT